MTNENQPEAASKPEPEADHYRAALTTVLMSTTDATADELVELMEKPYMIAELLVNRFQVLSGADESVGSLMELGVELAARGDRWKVLSGRAFDTLTKKPNEHWQKAAELAEVLLEEAACLLREVTYNLDGSPIRQSVPDLMDFQDAIDYARAAKETPEEVRLTFKNRYIKCAEHTASELMAERVQKAFHGAIEASQAIKSVGL